MHSSIVILILIALTPLIFAVSSSWWFWLPRPMKTIKESAFCLGDHAVTCTEGHTVNKYRLKAEEGYSVSNGDKTVVLHHFPSFARSLLASIRRASFLVTGLSMLMMLLSIIGNAKSELSEMSLGDFVSQVVPSTVLAFVSITPLAGIAYSLSNYFGGLLVPLDTTYAKVLEIAENEHRDLVRGKSTKSSKPANGKVASGVSTVDSLFESVGNDLTSIRGSSTNPQGKQDADMSTDTGKGKSDV